MTRRLLAVLLLAPLALIACQDEEATPTGPDAAPSATEVQTTQSSAGGVDVVVQLDREFAPGAHAPNKARAAEIAGELGIEPRYTYGTALFGFAGAVPEGRLEALEHDPRVVLVEKDGVVQAIDQTLPDGIDRVEVDQNGTANIDNSDDAMEVDIGIIDTGIDLDHQDLDAHDGVNCIDSGATADDDHGHGTHVAGSAAAIDNTQDVVGAAPGARVHAVKVLDSSGSGTWSSVICGIDWVTENYSAIEVANMSIGGKGYSATMDTALQESVNAGVFYAVAAGNDGADVYGSDDTFGTSDDYVPAAYPQVAAVSAMADFDGKSGGAAGRSLFIGCGWIYDDALADCFTNFSKNVVSTNPVTSPGAAIDVAAPGVSVLSTQAGGGTTTMSGTSMSSPHVAGVAALYIVQNGLTPSSASDVYSIRQALIDAGQAQSDWQSGDTRDPDSNPEPLVWALFGDTDSSPSVSWVNPTDGEEVSGSVTIQIDASDPEDDDTSLTVEWRVDGATTWQTATYNLDTGYYEDTWDSSGVSDGDYTLDARATDSSENSSTATITVSTENTDDAPTVSWVNPSDGETVSGTVSIQINASDDRDSGSDLTVEWQVDDGTWQTATYNSTSGYYEADWNSGDVADGDHMLDARATDTGSNTSAEASITVTVDNTTSSSTMHVGDLDSNSINNGSTWTAEVTITVHDGSHNAVADATVSGDWSGLGGGNAEFSSCTTNSSGQCPVRASGMHKSNGSVTYTVTSISHGSLDYDSTDNHDPDGDSDGTTITVSK